jgi:hypothetical protein
MIDRVKMRFKGPISKNGGLWPSGGGKNGNRPGLARSFGAFAIILTLIFALLTSAWAEDHKTRTITLLSSGLKTAATAQSSSFDVSAYTEGQIFVDATAEGGTSTLDITVQTSPDNVTWFTHTAMSQISATGQYRQAVTNFGNYMRISYTVGSTSFTFSVVGVFKN